MNQDKGCYVTGVVKSSLRWQQISFFGQTPKE